VLIQHRSHTQQPSQGDISTLTNVEHEIDFIITAPFPRVGEVPIEVVWCGVIGDTYSYGDDVHYLLLLKGELKFGKSRLSLLIRHARWTRRRERDFWTMRVGALKDHWGSTPPLLTVLRTIPLYRRLVLTAYAVSLDTLT
jgi:hypothetical protein